jgi:hypothetical protein
MNAGVVETYLPMPMRQATQAIAEETAIGWNGPSGNAGWFRTRGGVVVIRCFSGVR